MMMTKKNIGGAIAQRGFYFQNSVAALYLAKLIGKPDPRESECVRKVTVEVMGEKVFVDDIVVTYEDNHRQFIQVKENIRLSGSPWRDLWNNIYQQKIENFREGDRIVIFLGTESKSFLDLKEMCNRATGKDKISEVIFNMPMNILFKNILDCLNLDGKGNVVRSLSQDDIVGLLSSVDIKIRTFDDIDEKYSLEMPKSSVPAITLFRILRDMASYRARYSIPFDDLNLRKKLKDDHNIELVSLSNDVLEKFEPKTILIDDGEQFIMGSDNYKDEEKPQHPAFIQPYRIGQYPVTNGQFAEFVHQTKFDTSKLGWVDDQPPADQLPVTGVTFYEAKEYCDWLKKSTNGQRTYRLPNEAEWEKAARGNDGRKFPWGERWENKRSNVGASRPAKVDEYPPQSVNICYDMVGNIPEWTCSLWGEDWREPNDEYQYEWQPDDRNNLDASGVIRRVIRGGSFKSSEIDCRCSYRSHDLPDSRFNRVEEVGYGFRVVLELN